MNYQITIDRLFRNGCILGDIIGMDFIHPGIATIWIMNDKLTHPKYLDVKFNDISVTA
jgi:hypothetical protein